MNLPARRGSPMTSLASSFAPSSISAEALAKDKQSGPPPRPGRASLQAGPTKPFTNTALPSQPRLTDNHSVTPRELVNSICDTLCRSGYQALLVGGCVRDLLLGREPADYDVTTDATPEQVMTLFPESIAVGAQFGVILVPRDGLKVEVATF